MELNSFAGINVANAEAARRFEAYKTEFLDSNEFVQICRPSSFEYFETCFNLTVDLFKENGYPPPGASSDFIDLVNVAKFLPPDYCNSFFC